MRQKHEVYVTANVLVWGGAVRLTVGMKGQLSEERRETFTEIPIMASKEVIAERLEELAKTVRELLVLPQRSEEELGNAILEREEAIWGKGNVYLAEDIGEVGNEVWYTVKVKVKAFSPVTIIKIDAS